MLRTRRALLGALAALPALCSRGWADAATSPATIFREEPDPVTSADQVLNVMEFEPPLAREALPPAHFGYIATGPDDDRTVARGLAAFGQPGVEAVIDILNRELTTIMRQAGMPTIASITAAQVLRSGA